MSGSSESASEKQTRERLSPYMKNGTITMRKFREFIPALLITNLSNMLLVTANGLVVGNFVGSDGFACVSLVEPVEALINTASILAACSISTSLSKAMGNGDSEAFDKVRQVSLRLMAVIALLSVVAELPVAWLAIRSYNLDPVMYNMAWKYALIRILSSPVEITVTVFVYDLQIAGKMKPAMRHAIMQGMANLLFDLLFVACFHMGIAGAGYGTACALLLRAVVAQRYIVKHTNLFKRGRIRVRISDFRGILPYGIPDAAYQLMVMVQDYFIIKILLFAFGADGGIISGVCNFCLALASVLFRSVLNAARPLIGLLAGADDRRELAILMRRAIVTDLVLTGLVVMLAELMPSAFFRLYGVTDIPSGGLQSLRIYVPFIMIYACNTLLRMYLSNRNDSKHAAIVTVIGTATLPVFSYVFVIWLGPLFLWLGYSVSELLTLLFYLNRTRLLRSSDSENVAPDRSLYLSFDPGSAVPASDAVMEYLMGSGVDRRLSYRVALCLEEIGAYTQNAGKHGKAAEVYFRIKLTSESEAIVVILDDGKCIYFDQDDEGKRLITSNYGLIRKISKKTEYQYLLNMNYLRVLL